MRRPCPNEGKANVLGEGTGMCTQGAAGVGVQTRRKRLAEITSGRTCVQQWAGSKLQRPSERGDAEAGGRAQVWRMSPRERRRRGNALPEGRPCLPRGGNTGAWQRGSGRLAVPGWFSDTAPRQSRSSKQGLAVEQTSVGWGVCAPALKPRRVWEGSARKSQGQNRTGENPPSGIVGGLVESCALS
jgi:hypothetical protein